ncbi:PPPDE putative peptidase domain-containing protein [Gorgonomyces haynaldii]|nr:PPPDE putative peptidase domain-containing protein [Gorgonomyces haynaldii]
MSRVQVYLYDLSRGMAKQMSLQLTGKQVDGIWHTAVVVFGTEYAFGQGVEEFVPGESHYGHPVQVIDMGTTEIPQQVFLEFMDHMKSSWTADKYHLLDNNCNSFSDEVCQFLVGKGIPSHITGLPAEFLSTPFGQMIRPMIENMYGRSAHGSLENLSSVVKQCTHLPTLLQMIRDNKAVAVDFTSANCGPCKVISPEFERILQDKPHVLGVSVETTVARDICAHYQISATPTFIFFVDGKETARVRGANVAELKSNINLIEYIAYPPHKHAKLSLKHLKAAHASPFVLFPTFSKMELVTRKIQSILEANRLQHQQPYLESITRFISSNGTLELEDEAIASLKLVFETLSEDVLFPFVDLGRLLLVFDSVHERALKVLLPNVLHLTQKLTGNQDKDVDATKVMLFRFLCNIFKSEARKQLVENVIVTGFVIDNLLCSYPQLRQATAVFVFNLTKLSFDLESRPNEEWALELVAALTTRHLLTSIGFILYKAPSEILEFANAVSVDQHLNAIAKHYPDLQKLSSELNTL